MRLHRIAAVEDLSTRELPASMIPEWTELTYMQKLEGNTAVFIFPLCMLFVFLTRNAVRTADFFQIPPSRVVELGAQVAF